MEFQELIPGLITLIVTLSMIVFFDFLFRKRNMFVRERIVQQLIFVAILLTGILVMVFTLPIEVEDKNLILTFASIVIGAIIAFSSTTFVANAMAGIMLRLIHPFRVGDFIETDSTFGRVTEIYFLHTQIQSIDRDLITIPNLTLISKPLKTIRTSGTIITTKVSLGYNIPRKEIEKSLVKAAEITELESPFVHVEELGDFSISYKVGGLLKNIEGIITAKSDFRKNVIDSLHNNNIEIVSPTYMNQRALSEDYVCIPPREHEPDRPEKQDNEVATEDIIFDKAIIAQMLDRIYNIGDNMPGRRRQIEDRIKEITDQNTRQELKKQLEALTAKEEDLKPATEELRNLPDITSLPDEENDIYIKKIIDNEKNIVSLDNKLTDLEHKLNSVLEKQ